MHSFSLLSLSLPVQGLLPFISRLWSFPGRRSGLLLGSPGVPCGDSVHGLGFIPHSLLLG